MKKIALSLAAFSLIFGASDEEILKLYDGAPAEIKISIDQRIKVEQAPQYDLVVLKIEHNGASQNEFVFTKDNLVFFDIVDIKTKQSLKSVYEEKINSKKIATFYQKEKAENILKLGNDPKKRTLVIFTDPECPYCRQELAKIEERLKEYNIEMIFTPVHGLSSLQKSALILQHGQKAKTDKEKIEIARKYYDEKIELKEKISDDKVANIQDLITKYRSAGINGVPKIVEKSKLK